MISRREFIKSLSSLPLLAIGFSPLKYLWGQDRNWASLRALLAGTGANLHLPGEQAYSNFKSLFNLRHRASPSAIVRGASTTAIQQTIQWAQENQVPVHSRSGGHSFEALSSGPGLVIDTRPFNQISIDREAKRCRVGAGVMLGNLIQVLAQAGFALPTGSCATVGVAGLTLGGGMGLSSRSWGLTCDRLVSAKAILADGSSVTLSETENSDLFWAIRGGGGGSYCIVTEFEFSLMRALDVYTFAISWPATYFSRVLRNWEKQILNGSEQINSILKITANSSGAQEVKIVGQILSQDNLSAPTENEARSLLSDFLGQALLNSATTKRFQRRSFADAATYFAGGEDPPVRFKSKSSYAYEALSDEGVVAIEDALSELPSRFNLALMFDAYGGAIANKATNDTAFFHRKALYSVQYYVQWATDDESSSKLSTMRSVYSKINPHFSGYAYVNYCDADLVNPLELYFGDNLERLAQIKLSRDPHNIFRNSIQNFNEQVQVIL